MKPKTKIIFFGTSDFATPVLEALIQANYIVAAVVTAPDSKTIPPAKQLALIHGIEVLQPENFKTDPVLVRIGEVAKQSTVGIVVDYGKIIPERFLRLSKFGLLNIHGSLLPKYRGPSPIQYALLNGENETGVTIFVLDEKIDHGPVLGMEHEPIALDDKYYDLKMRLVKKGAELLLKLLPKYLNGEITPQPQDESQATFTKLISKEDGKIDWHKEAGQIYNQFRAFHKWPGVWFNWQNKILKIIDCRTHERLSETQLTKGKIYREKEQLFVPCSKGCVELLKLQFEGGKILSAKEFLNGYGRLLEKA
ncbi:MAG: methionyl-tRNA formyltransferase [Candidatus Harrisonbacteria bacterium RIFCSPLOWO2_02_FULL_41_13b]|uniref:Methionyl-tRNA formyltransferase n=1 Tax=Candidatus Harrisonbacteria bacterium RIFCSPLOWO2_02_FULL_41_13b TaxID=1798409 RepID=A0A1G1ZTG9_9BACT|nr:MAG: methionyl-tRNA formyltransferase [Candidatus Harrisonbacteria bacterium RIFCSPLOWO2_02_FULL_41_13b]